MKFTKPVCVYKAVRVDTEGNFHSVFSASEKTYYKVGETVRKPLNYPMFCVPSLTLAEQHGVSRYNLMVCLRSGFGTRDVQHDEIRIIKCKSKGGILFTACYHDIKNNVIWSTGLDACLHELAHPGLFLSTKLEVECVVNVPRTVFHRAQLATRSDEWNVNELISRLE